MTPCVSPSPGVLALGQGPPLWITQIYDYDLVLI